MDAWYALFTKPKAEAQVARALLDRGFDIFLPMLPPRSNGRSQPLFPTYLFLRCDLSTLPIDEIQWLPGFRSILAFEGKAAVVPDKAIAIIREGLAEIDARGGLGHGFHPGDVVVIDSGPMSGLRGIFQGPMGAAERVKILVDFLGATNRVEVPADQLRRASDDAAGHDRKRGTRGRGRRINYASPKSDS